MTVYVLRDGALIEKSEAPQSSGPFFLADEMPPVRSMADGRTYTSRGDYYRHLAATQHRIHEKGE